MFGLAVEDVLGGVVIGSAVQVFPPDQWPPGGHLPALSVVLWQYPLEPIEYPLGQVFVPAKELLIIPKQINPAVNKIKVVSFIFFNK